jgi:hypothetical protein
MATDTMLAVVKACPERGWALAPVWTFPAASSHEVLIRVRATQSCCAGPVALARHLLP